MRNGLFDWIFRFFKGMLIGTGAILPGVSGGALAAVFGIYERMISFLAHLTRDFKKNVLFFIPVGMGMLFGVFLLSFALSYFFEVAETQLLWFFVGCIAGIMPALFAQAGKHGRKPRHWVMLVVTAVVALLFLKNAQHIITGTLPQNFWTWAMAGIIFGLGMIVPGLSPSNFLVYLNLYKPMTDGIKRLDMGVVVPLMLGVVGIVLLLSKVMDYVFRKAYTGMFHVIFGVVVASTLIIIPLEYNYASLGTLWCALACGVGVALGLWMSRLEDKYKPEQL